ncbi:MAG: hypothetical protein WC866_04330 [Patescibacteria group bacterium]
MDDDFRDWYMRLVKAELVDITLKAWFANGDEFSILEIMMPGYGKVQTPTAVLYDGTDGPVIQLTVLSESVEITADMIRLEHDPRYAMLKAESMRTGTPLRSQAAAEFCGCGKHGRLVGIDGFRGPEFFSRPSALYMLDASAEWRRYSPKTIERLRELILSTPLPLKDKDAHPDMVEQVLRWNTLQVAHGGTLDHARFHELMQPA